MSLGAARLLRSGGPLLGLVAAWLLFAATAGQTFTSWANTELMLLQTAVVGIAALGALWVIAGGGIDLSVGSSVAVGTMVGALALQQGAPWPLGALAAIAACTGVGFAIGTLVTGGLLRVLTALAAGGAVAWLAAGWPPTARLPLAGAAAVAGFLATARLSRTLPLSPFIVTLGLWGALRGLAKGLGGNQPVYFPRHDGLAGLMLPGNGLLPPGVWILLASAAAAAVLLRTTVFGRHALAIGQNREAARLSGVDVPRVECGTYCLAGACAGIAAVLQLAYLSMGDPTTAQGLELRAIAATVIGGASLAGGEGSVLGTLVGALVMTVVDNGCTKLGLDNWVQEVVTGAIIVGAVALDRARQRRR